MRQQQHDVPTAGLVRAKWGLAASRSPFATIPCDIGRVSCMPMASCQHMLLCQQGAIWDQASPASSHASMAACVARPLWSHVGSGKSHVFPCQHGSLCCQATLEPGVTRPTWWGMPAMPAWVQPFTWPPGCGTDPHVHGLSPTPGEHGHRWTLECMVNRVIPCPYGPMQSW